MRNKAGRLGILIVFIVITLLAIGLFTIYYTEVGMAKEIGIQEPRLSEYDHSVIPQSVIEDATELAREVVGNSQDKVQAFVDQLLATYVEARDRDVVVFFNSGGWGWNMLVESPGWSSIINGIKSELDSLGCKSLVLNYRRTSSGLRGCMKELLEVSTRYPSKAKELAKRVEFLTKHNPNLRVIVAGESTGTVISDRTMGILQENTQVYSIQTGTPFWHMPTPLERTLLMNSNGKTIDTFSYGNVPAMVWASVKSWFGLSSPEDNPGTILSWLKAPGHDYSWQYPGVCSEVVKFQDENFGANK